MIFDDNHNYFIVKLNLYKLINPISPESGIKNAISAGSGRDIHLKSSQQARSSWLSSTLFGLHVSDPHTVRKTYLYEEVLKNPTFLPPRPDKKNNAFLHNVFTTNDSLLCILKFHLVKNSMEEFLVLFLIPFAPFFVFL